MHTYSRIGIISLLVVFSAVFLSSLASSLSPAQPDGLRESTGANYLSSFPRGGNVDEVEEAFDQSSAVRVIVWLKDNEFTSPSYQTDRAKKQSEIEKLQDNVLDILTEDDFMLRFRYKTANGFAGILTKSGFQKFKDNPFVDAIFLDREIHTLLTESRPLIQADLVEKSGYTGKGQTVCVLDTGIDYTHPSLGGCFGSDCKVMGGFDFCNGPSCTQGTDADPIDENGHGTNVAGIVASHDIFYRGIAPDARLIAVKVSNATGFGTLDAVAAGIDWCVQNKDLFNISIITMSFGLAYPLFCPSTINPMITNAHSAGMFIDAASGNEGYLDKLYYPACAPHVVSVGAIYDTDVGFQVWCLNNDCTLICTDPTTEQDNIACFTNRGSDLDMLAPGVLITAPDLNGAFTPWSGTSQAAPHVAGAAALLKEALPDLTANQIESILKETGVPVFDLNTSLTFPRIDVFAALQQLPWWNPAWEFRKQIIIAHNNQNELLEEGYTINLTFDHAGLVREGKSLPDGADIRIVYKNGELDRVNTTPFNVTQTTVLFALQENISPLFIDNTSYFLYYGNMFADSPPANKSEIYLFYDDFDSLDAWEVSIRGSGSCSVGGGVLTITGTSGENGCFVQTKNVFSHGINGLKVVTRTGQYTLPSGFGEGPMIRINYNDDGHSQVDYNTVDRGFDGNTTGIDALWTFSNQPVPSDWEVWTMTKDAANLLINWSGRPNGSYSGPYTRTAGFHEFALKLGKTNVIASGLASFKHDYIHATKFVNPEPTVLLGLEQSTTPQISVDGSPTLGSTLTISLNDPLHPDTEYVQAMSLGTSPGIVLEDGRVIPLNQDQLFSLSVFSPQIIGLQDSGGFLDSDGNAQASWTIPVFPSLIGKTIYFAFITRDLTLPLPQRIISISPAVNVTILS